MGNLYIQTESKIFCILIVAFLYLFQIKSFQQRCRENILLYFFSFAGILFSITVDITENQVIHNICLVLCGLSSLLAMYFCFKYALRIAELRLTKLKKALFTFVSIIFGILSFCSSAHNINAVNFILVFTIIVLFVAEQYNKIRVDNLTKLYNRYGMDVELKEQLRQYKREHNDSFYVIACDIDNFKHINDTWGHSEGDRALILIAGALAKVGKMFSSNVFRIGGDEFVIITDTSEESLALDITNKIETELDNIDFRTDFNIEMSIGTALYDGKTTIDELLKNADKKLYEAKRESKQRII